MSLQKIESYFASPVFLVMAILMSVSAVLSFNIITILLVIGMWIAFAEAKKGTMASGFTGVKMISGTVKANYIIAWIAIGLIILAALLCFVAAPAASGIGGSGVIEFDPEEFTDIEDIPSLFGGIGTDNVGSIGSVDLPSEVSQLVGILEGILGSASIGGVIGSLITVVGILLLIVVAILIIVNLCFFRRIHTFTKSVCVSFENGAPALAPVGAIKAVKNWSMFSGVVTAISALGSVSDAKAFLGTACIAVTYILGFVFMKSIVSDIRTAESAVGTV